MIDSEVVFDEKEVLKAGFLWKATSYAACLLKEIPFLRKAITQNGCSIKDFAS